MDSQPFVRVSKTSMMDFKQKVPESLAGIKGKYSSALDATNLMHDTDIVMSEIQERSSLQQKSGINSLIKKTYDTIEKIDPKARLDENNIEKGKIDYCKYCRHCREIESTKKKRKHSQEENIIVSKSISNKTQLKSLLIPVRDVLRDREVKKKYEKHFWNSGKTKISSDPDGACISNKYPVTHEFQDSFPQAVENTQDSGMRDLEESCDISDDRIKRIMDTSGSVPGESENQMRLREVFSNDWSTFLQENLKLFRNNFYLLTAAITMVGVIIYAFMYGSGSQVYSESNYEKRLRAYFSKLFEILIS